MLLDLVPAAGVAGALFDRPDDARSQARMAVLDVLNKRFGRGTVTYGTTGRQKQAWGDAARLSLALLHDAVG